METISNVASAASKAIWGENNPQATTQGNETHGQEPISGQQGKGTINEPFDQGNSVDPTSATPATSTYDNNSSRLTGTSNTPGLTGHSSSGLTGGTSSGLTGNGAFSDSTGGTSSGLTGNGAYSDSTGNTSVLPDRTATKDKSFSDLTGTSTNDKSSSNLAGTSTKDKSFSDLTGTSTNDKSSSKLTGTSTSDTTSRSTDPMSSDIPNDPTSVAAGGERDPLTTTDKTGVIAGRTGDATKGSDIIPSERQSNTGAPSGGAPEFKQQGADKPDDTPHTAEERDAIREKKTKAEDFLDTKDPNDYSGEPMKMHGGDAVGKTQAERRKSKVGNPGGQEHKGEAEGTGEKVVRVDGTISQGIKGDNVFDATKPGAGREADRLLEEQGVKRTGGAPPAAEPAEGATGASGASKEDKPSMGDKIKAKLHLGHKDK